MPDVSTQFPDLAGLNAAELDQRRRDIVARIAGIPVDDVDLDTLRELSALTAQLRKKSAGPPPKAAANGKAAPKKGPVKKATVADIFDAL